MTYKNKDKQREAQRVWVRQKRAEQKGSTSTIDTIKAEHPVDYKGRSWQRCKDEIILKAAGVVKPTNTTPDNASDVACGGLTACKGSQNSHQANHRARGGRKRMLFKAGRGRGRGVVWCE